MAGHSKWAKVKHFKGAIDAKRARIFAKLSREITVAAKVGGGDPERNPRLRMALLKCRSANMPSDNIERAVKKGTGSGDTASFEDLAYEIYGPHGVALLVELSTDNRNRTAECIVYPSGIGEQREKNDAPETDFDRRFSHEPLQEQTKEAAGQALPRTGEAFLKSILDRDRVLRPTTARRRRRDGALGR